MSDIRFVPWPPAGFEFYREQTKCLFCDKRATQCAFFRSPYHFSIANRCCNDYDCMTAALWLAEQTIKFDEEINGRS